jgi:riboflavin synthase
MFTGIIAGIGRVRAVQPGGDTRYEIATALDLGNLTNGASIACAGACLSVVAQGAGWFAVQASAETKSRSTIAAWRVGTPVNLERSLRLGDELGGHMVAGHVDAIAKIVAQRDEGDSRRLTVEAPRDCEMSIASKGSVTLDGVSLTVNEVKGARFGINLIPVTLEKTTLGDLKPGDSVNLEIDLVARYVARLMAMAPA